MYLDMFSKTTFLLKKIVSTLFILHKEANLLFTINLYTPPWSSVCFCWCSTIDHQFKLLIIWLSVQWTYMSTGLTVRWLNNLFRHKINWCPQGSLTVVKVEVWIKYYSTVVALWVNQGPSVRGPAPQTLHSTFSLFTLWMGGSLLIFRSKDFPPPL